MSSLPQSPPLLIAALNDRDLLRRFVQDADENAFAEIVTRYQGLVMGVCRRVIGNHPDVDDAFQATFITLARRPRQIRSTASLSSWLYTVAWRTSLRLVRQRRKNPVEPLTQHPLDNDADPLDRIASAQDCLVLDEELNDLPSNYRDVLVMTYFSSQTSQQIADQLNVSKGTVDGRIRQARNMLRIRLARRGVAIGALTVAAGLSCGASAAASSVLLEATIQLGAQTLNGSLPGTTDLSHLEPFIRPETTMLSSKLLATSILCTTAIVGVIGLSGFARGQSDGPGDATPTIDGSVAETKEADAGGDPFGSELPVAAPVISVVSDTPADSGSKPSNKLATGANRKFQYYSADARPSERWMHEVLEKPVPLLDFPGETPLTEILEQIQTWVTDTHGDGEFRLTIYPDRRELDLDGISSLEDVQINDITLEGIELQNALKLIFDQTSDPELTYEIKNEVMVITTKDKAESDASLVTRVYHAGELLDLDYGDYGAFRVRGGLLSMQFAAGTLISQDPQPGASVNENPDAQMQPTPTPVTLASLVMEMTTPPCRWAVNEGEGGAIQIVGRSLVVRQTQEGHREIVRLLNLLSETMKIPE